MAAKPTYQELEKSILDLRNTVREMQAYKDTLESTNHELLNINNHLESAIERANRMTIDAEITYIELNHIFNAAADGMCVVDKDFNILKINSTFSELFGIDKEQAANKKCFDLIPGNDCRGSRCPLKRILDGESKIEYDVEKKSANGSMIACILSASAFHDPSGDIFGMVLNFRDITYRKQMEERLRELATTDELTKLHNRRHFLELATQELDRLTRFGTIFSMLLMDVDLFKSVNDTYGHDTGDKALIMLAECGKTALRSIDSFGRIGGEEFAVILPNTDLKGAVTAGERLRRTVENACIPTDKGPLSFTISIGVAQAQPERANLGELLKSADKALYLAKEKGRNRVEVFTE